MHSGGTSGSVCFQKIIKHIGTSMRTKTSKSALAAVNCFLRGHPFMTSRRRGRGQAQVDACGRGKRGQSHVDVHKENY